MWPEKFQSGRAFLFSVFWIKHSDRSERSHRPLTAALHAGFAAIDGNSVKSFTRGFEFAAKLIIPVVLGNRRDRSLAARIGIGPRHGLFAPLRKIERRNNVLYRRLIGELACIGLNRLRLLHGPGDRGRIGNGLFNAHTTHGTTGKREHAYANHSPAQCFCTAVQAPEIVFTAKRLDGQRYSLISTR